MFGVIARKVFGSANERILKRMQRDVEVINGYEEELAGLSDAELQTKTPYFRELLEQGKSLEDILPEAFAVVREASKRTIGLRHFDVQLVGGMILHHGKISEMKTGEGKTLVATLPCYLNALQGKGVHVVTVNDYLAQRDAEWMGAIHSFLGLTVGCVIHDISEEERKAAYDCDITYGTNNEFGFDYLRDNMKFMREAMVQRPFNFAIVDEVDSILVDEARTPLIISGPTEDNSELYVQIDKLMPKLKEGDYEKDEKARSVVLTEEGNDTMEQLLKEAGLITEDSSMYDFENMLLVHHCNQGLRAHTMFEKDVDYIVKDDKVVIIDEFTGRMMEGRRYSEGLHQALEAKEQVKIQNENQTLASITFQNYFRMYPKLAGMTGTAMTEATEFHDIYNLEVVEIPTNQDVVRADEEDLVFSTEQEKYDAIIELIKERNKANQPMLVGTVSIEKSEYLSAMLQKAKIKHNVLNARHHDKEAYIIAQAGRPGAVTIATNMAGRGTDIKLGGNDEMQILEELGESDDSAEYKAKAQKISDRVEQDKAVVIEAGGLFVLGTERHESRRIDNQLRGRSGRQGDPGTTLFMLSLEDDLLRIFGADRLRNFVAKGLPEGESLTSPWLSRALAKAQQRVEQRNYEIRKNLLKYDDVMNDQRKVIYDQRVELMEADDVSGTIEDMREEVLEEIIETYMPEKSYAEQWDIEGLQTEIHRLFAIQPEIVEWAKEEGIADQEILGRLQGLIKEHFEAKETLYGEDIVRTVEKRIMLMTLDQLWKDHLLFLDHLRQGINLRAYGQKDPLNEYKKEAFYSFTSMLDMLRKEVTARLAHIQINIAPPEEEMGMPQRPMHETRQDPALAPSQQHPGAQQEGGGSVVPIHKRVATEDRDPNDPSSWGRVGRNEFCPCGSGKKFKHCHGKLAG